MSPRVLFVYPYCTRGGVESGLSVRMRALARLGIAADALFFEDRGGLATFADGPGRVFVNGHESAFRERLQAGRYDVVSVIDAYVALDWLARKRIAVINLSLTGPENPVLQRAVARLVAKGHVLVAAVGNEGPLPIWRAGAVVSAAPT